MTRTLLELKQATLRRKWHFRLHAEHERTRILVGELGGCNGK